MDKQNKIKKVTTINELAVMINNGFQTNQEYMDKRFDELKGEIKGVDSRLVKVERKLEGVEKKLDGFIDVYAKEKLPMRVEYIENILNVPKK